MAFIKIGKTFKSKSGKATVWVVSEKELELLSSKLQEHEKYGKQVSLIITGSAEGQYGHSVSIIEGDRE